jgi:arsenical pump membrane protein
MGASLGVWLVTGSLSTILWLSALRREGLHVGMIQFFKLDRW